MGSFLAGLGLVLFRIHAPRITGAILAGPVTMMFVLILVPLGRALDTYLIAPVALAVCVVGVRRLFSADHKNDAPTKDMRKHGSDT